MRRLVALAVVLVTLSAGAPASARPVAVAYEAPVDAPLVDLFRPPASPYGPGNRGVDYDTEPGTGVRAAAAGEVTFAGQVGGTLHVVVLHADGVRTSYSFLASVAVRRGDRLGSGHVLGRAGPVVHFGARVGDAYIDPLLLLSGGAHVYLVPDGTAEPQAEARERSRLEQMLRQLPGAALRVGGAAVGWARQAAPSVELAVRTGEQAWAWMPAVWSPTWPVPLRVAVAAKMWMDSRSSCTPAGATVPRAGGRRLAVMVGGLGSTSARAAIDDLDTAALGYDPGDVARFSYRGGVTAEQGYEAADTQVDLRTSGRRLRVLLERLAAENPGVPIDVIAHSQGGLVARSALGDRAPPAVEHLVTLGTPHHGADVATALARASAGTTGVGVTAMARRLGVTDLDARSASVGQLSETSEYIRDLDAAPLPPGVAVTSIAARGDVVVASPQSRLWGAANAVVDVPGLSQHSALPGSAAAGREVALALADMAPTCETLPDAVADAVVGQAIGDAEDLTGLALAAAGR